MSINEADVVIVRHIDDLEAALRHIRGTMEPALGRAVAEISERFRKAAGWAGKIDGDLNGPHWMAPDQWRTADDTKDNFDLYLEFADSNCIDGDAAETWIGSFAGFAGGGVRLVFGSNALGSRDWKAVLRNEVELIEELAARGFSCDPKSGDLSVRVKIDAGGLAEAFGHRDFSIALEPLSQSLEQVAAARELLDALVAAIRKKSTTQ